MATQIEDHDIYLVDDNGEPIDEAVSVYGISGGGGGGDGAISGATYVIYEDAGTIKAVDGTTGQTDYSGSDFVTVLEDAISGLPSAGGTIDIREGTYTVASTINITRSDVHIRGTGWGTELTAANGLDSTMVQIGDGGTTEVRRVFLTNLSFDGNKANQAAGDVIHSNKATWFVHLRNVRIENAYNDAVRLESDSSYFCVWHVIENCKIKNSGGHGIYMVGSKTRDHFIHSCSIRNNGADGVNATGSGQNWHHIYQCGILANRTGVRFSGDWCNVEGCHFEFNDERGVFVDGGTKGSVTGNTFRQNSQGSAGTYDEILANGSRIAVQSNAGDANDSNYAVNKTSGDYDVVTGNTFANGGYNNNGGANSVFNHNV